MLPAGVELYSEEPYGCALDNSYLTQRCSHCLRPAEEPCKKQCGMVVYCNDKCAQYDLPFHENECVAFRSLPEKKPDPSSWITSVRLMGRLLARKALDKGVASLSTGFPKNVKEHKFNNMTSNYSNVKNADSRRTRMKYETEMFFKFFIDTSLGKMKQKTVERVYCIMFTNSFKIFEDHAGRPDSWSSMGLGVYLNTSRFKHSCRPTAYVVSSNSTLRFYKIDPATPTDTAKRFNKLTLDYGTWADVNYGCHMWTIAQRQKSLQERYFFKCRCQLCADNRMAQLQENASPYECRSCNVPYVWNGGKKLKSVCTCNRKPPVVLNDAEREELKELETLWPVIMSMFYKNEANLHKLIPCSQRVLSLARQFWHQKWNLRNGQLRELVYKWYASLADLVPQGNSEENRNVALRVAVSSGWRALSVYSKQDINYSSLAWMSWDLAGRCMQITDDENGWSKRNAYRLFSMAALVFREMQLKDTEQQVLMCRDNALSREPHAEITVQDVDRILQEAEDDFQQIKISL